MSSNFSGDKLTLLFIIARIHMMHTWISSVEAPMFSRAACLVLRLATAGLAAPSPSESADRARRLHVAVRVDLSSVGPLHSDVVVLTGETK